MKEFLFSIWIISLSSHLKLSIDIFIMSVRHVFAYFWFIFVKRSCSRRDGRKRIIVFFILKHILLILWVHTNKSRPFTVLNYVLLLPLWQILRHILSCFYWKKFAWLRWCLNVLRFIFHSPQKLWDAAHIYLGLTFKHCYMLELFYYRIYFRQVVMIWEG